MEGKEIEFGAVRERSALLVVVNEDMSRGKTWGLNSGSREFGGWPGFPPDGCG